MSEYINETAKAYLTVFQTLPTETQAEVKKLLMKKNEKRKINFSSLVTKGWTENKCSYSREEIYD
jgi:hypothetical protein